MTVLDVIRERGSVREYEDRPIAEDTIKEVFEAARLAQSAGNMQPWEFVVVREKEMKNKLVSGFVGEAPVVVVCVAHPENCGQVGSLDSYLVDVAIAVENIALVSWELGLGSCWIGAYDEDKIKGLLGIPENLRIVSLLAMGYPAEKPANQIVRQRRKPLAQIMHYEKYMK